MKAAPLARFVTFVWSLSLVACITDDTGPESGADASSADLVDTATDSRDLSDAGPDAREVAEADADAGDAIDAADTTDTGDTTDAAEPDLPEPVEVGLTIEFDYRFDTRGFFSDAAARGVLDEAARQWGVVLRDDFEAIAAGTLVYVRNPEDTSEQEHITLEAPIDDLLVFVGSAPRASSAAGSSATASFPAEQDDPELRAALMERWDGDDFEPWTGWISFDSDRIWFFDTSFETGDDIPSDTNDALTVTLHELGHILGVAPGWAFEQHVDDGHFVGPNAVAVYGGPVPLADGYGHIAEGVTIDGQIPIMAIGRLRGVRYAITRLDIAILADVGYEVLGL